MSGPQDPINDAHEVSVILLVKYAAVSGAYGNGLLGASLRAMYTTGPALLEGIISRFPSS